MREKTIARYDLSLQKTFIMSSPTELAGFPGRNTYNTSNKTIPVSQQDCCS